MYSRGRCSTICAKNDIDMLQSSCTLSNQVFRGGRPVFQGGAGPLGPPRNSTTAYITSYWTSIATLVPSCRVSEILELLYAESHFFSTPPVFGRKFRVFPLEYTGDVWVAKSEHQAHWW